MSLPEFDLSRYQVSQKPAENEEGELSKKDAEIIVDTISNIAKKAVPEWGPVDPGKGSHDPDRFREKKEGE